MKKKSIFALLISAMLLSSCSGSTPANTETMTARNGFTLVEWGGSEE